MFHREFCLPQIAATQTHTNPSIRIQLLLLLAAVCRSMAAVYRKRADDDGGNGATQIASKLIEIFACCWWRREYDGTWIIINACVCNATNFRKTSNERTNERTYGSNERRYLFTSNSQINIGIAGVMCEWKLCLRFQWWRWYKITISAYVFVYLFGFGLVLHVFDRWSKPSPNDLPLQIQGIFLVNPFNYI